MPIAAIAERLAAHPRQPWLLVDGAQTLGSIPVEEAAGAADIYACTGHKWCCGPEGLGAIALSERLLVESRPTLIGWRSLSDEGSASSGFHGDGRRFEVATSCTPLMAGLNQSLQLLEACGTAEERWEQIRARSGQLWGELVGTEGISPLLTSPPPAGLVSFTLTTPEGSERLPEEVVKQLGRQGLWLRTLEDPACIRACTHLTTTPEEVERLVRSLATLVAA
jgi:L-cysteine/cystine lyase